VSSEERLRRAEQLLARVDELRGELARLSEQGDAEQAIEVLAQLGELAKEVEQELSQAKREADADA
jgi:hypothetical protein